MPETVNGYELFQLCWGKDPDEGIGFAVYESDLGEDGNSVGVLYGADTGRRHWKLTFPVLAGVAGQEAITVRGVTMTPEAYLWDFFCRYKRSGLPFVMQSPRNDQYYLAKFVDRELSYTRAITKLYSTGIELMQRRVPGVTVFDPAKLPGVWGWWDENSWILDDQSVNDKSSNNHDLAMYGTDFIPVSNAQNGRSIFRFNSTITPGPDPTGIDDGHTPDPTPVDPATSFGAFLRSPLSPTIKEAFFAVNIYGATFPNYGGLLTSDAFLASLVGNNGTAKFYNFGFGSTYEYRKNGILYAESNQQAPMNAFGLVHARWEDGVTLAHLQIGKDRDFGTRYLRMDLGEWWLGTDLLPESDALEAAEHWQTGWGV